MERQMNVQPQEKEKRRTRRMKERSVKEQGMIEGRSKNRKMETAKAKSLQTLYLPLMSRFTQYPTNC